MKKMKFFMPVLALVAAAALSACGGGSDGGGAAGSGGGGGGGVALVPGSDVPVSATQSIAGMLAFMNSVIAATSETSEPLVLGDATFPVDDTNEVIS